MGREPLLHTGITDVLDDSHPLAWTTIYCSHVDCHTMLHASNNENMCGWVETGLGPFCLRCFQILEETEDIEPYALPDDEVAEHRDRGRSIAEVTAWLRSTPRYDKDYPALLRAARRIEDWATS